MRGINPSGGAESGLDAEKKGINPSDSAESELDAEKKGINPSDGAESERMRSISAPEFQKSWPTE
ncbi:hypothetical protein NST69_24995 [Paenibacillus sp. FSL P2-0089]|uniref:hypothetical protein n=1 Tax=Paenibacillus sp. FSL P2-0089 TaxID=2954526 RepID=UPI003159C279